MKKPIALIVGCLTLLAADSCHVHRSRSEELHIWRSPESSVSDRLDAARVLIPTGTSLESAIGILGEPTDRHRLHGPAVDFRSGGQDPVVTTNIDIWRLVYDFHGGDLVCLDFQIDSREGKNWPFLRAFCASTEDIKPLESFGPRATNSTTFE